jgi:hypothetical protein
MIRRAALGLCLLFAAGRASAELTAVGLNKSGYTSDFMVGHVVVSVIFPESNGVSDANVETWSEERKALALSEIMAGLDWWTRQNPRSALNFTVVSQTIPTRYEPITRPYYDEGLWIPDVMSQLGYSGSRFGTTRDYVNALRTQYGADWGYVVFVVDSLVDTNGKFADGYFAYAYLGGPFMVMTYDNNGYGITNMDAVFAHESGHIFHALDEYAGASSPSDYSNGYFRTINGNHQYSSVANDPNSIMRGGIRWGLDSWAKLMIGWRDSDGNNRDDILDQSPAVSYASQPGTQSGVSNFSGSAKVSVLPRQGNVQGYGLTVDTIAKVEYRLGDGSWAAAAPVDGQFNNGAENFSFNLSGGDSGTQSVGAQSVDVRVTTEYSMGTSGTGGTQTAPVSLSNAHPFPNPYKPNSALGHTTVTFSGLTPGARVQIFTPTGEPVYDKTIDPSASSLSWNAVNDEGQDLSSGVYLYLITDEGGNKKDGKLAIVR